MDTLVTLVLLRPADGLAEAGAELQCTAMLPHTPDI
jgi:hypothetical protein